MFLAVYLTDDYCSTKVFILCSSSITTDSINDVTGPVAKNETCGLACGTIADRYGGTDHRPWSGQTVVLVILGVVTNFLCGWIVYKYVRRRSEGIIQHIKQNSGLPPLPKAKDMLNLSRVVLMIAGGTLALLPFTYIELFLDVKAPPLSNSALILVLFTPMAMVMCFLVPVLIMSVANDSRKFVRGVFLWLICVQGQ